MRVRKCCDMPYHTGIVLRIYPSNRQKRIIAVNDGCGRFVYNRLVALNNERYRLSKAASLVPAYAKRIEDIDRVLHNPDKTVAQTIKNGAPFLYGDDVDSLTIENAVKNYRAAWKKFRDDKSAGIPVFHRKGYEQSYQTNAHYRKDGECIDDSNVRIEDLHHVTLPIIGRIRMSGSYKRLAGLMHRKNTRIGTVTISMDTIGRYYASLQIAGEEPFVQQGQKTGALVGIDLNIENFLWDSNGVMVENPKYKRDIRSALAKAQRTASRRCVRARKEGRKLSSSVNYQKARKKAALLYERAANRGNDFRHRVSRGYVENQDYIFAEDLKVRNLLKNHRLAFAISECGWSDFLNKLAYKAEMYGKTFLKVPPQYTTQTCSVCGHRLTGDEKLTLGDREWICPECGTYHLRDYNSAKNILAAGIKTLRS